jgi:hypothetical protein
MGTSGTDAYGDGDGSEVGEAAQADKEPAKTATATAITTVFDNMNGFPPKLTIIQRFCKYTTPPIIVMRSLARGLSPPSWLRDVLPRFRHVA